MARSFERRAYPRLDARFSVSLSGPSGTFVTEALDLSLGGLRLDAELLLPHGDTLATAKPLFQGALVSVEFETHDGTPVQAFARVRWWVDTEIAVGVEFLDLPSGTRATLSAFMETLANLEDDSPR